MHILWNLFLFTSISICGLGLEACPIDEKNKIDLINGRWELFDTNSELDSYGIYFTIDNEKITGFDGCNQFGGELGNLNSVFISEKFCPDTESIFDFKELKSQIFIDSKITGNELHIFYGETLFKFLRKEDDL